MPGGFLAGFLHHQQYAMADVGMVWEVGFDPFFYLLGQVRPIFRGKLPLSFREGMRHLGSLGWLYRVDGDLWSFRLPRLAPACGELWRVNDAFQKHNMMRLTNWFQFKKKTKSQKQPFFIQGFQVGQGKI